MRARLLAFFDAGRVIWRIIPHHLGSVEVQYAHNTHIVSRNSNCDVAADMR